MVGWCLAGSTFGGCFFELRDPVTRGAGGAGASGGASGMPSNGGDAGSADGGGAGGVPCESGFKSCGGDCVSVDDPGYGCSPDECEACGADTQAPHASFVCEVGACRVATCDDDYGDCNGNPSDGCEVGFSGFDRPPSTLPIARLPSGDTDRWAGVTRYAMKEVCRGCATQSPLPPVNSVMPPLAQDLSATFQVAWDDAFLYLRFAVRDDAIVDTPVPIEQDLADAAFQDCVELLLDGDNAGGAYGPTDRQLFVAADNTLDSADHRDPPAPAMPEEFVLTPSRGTACYQAELALLWTYVLPTEATAGTQFGFTVGVNDWDPVTSRPDSGGAVQRDTQLFSVVPSNMYWTDNSTLGRAELMP